MRAASVRHDYYCGVLFGDALRRDARLMWTPATAMPPSPTAAAQRLTESERTSPAANTPGRLVSSGPGARFILCQAEDCATFAPVRMKPLSSRSISAVSPPVQGTPSVIGTLAG